MRNPIDRFSELGRDKGKRTECCNSIIKYYQCWKTNILPICFGEGSNEMHKDITIASLIGENRNNMTKSEMKVADLVLRAQELSALFPASVVAGKAGVSEATMTRFCRRLGLSGYQELQEISRNSVLYRLQSDTSDRLEQSLLDNGDLEDMMNHIMEYDSQNLSFLSEENRSMIRNLIDDICTAEKVFSVGVRTSSFPASFLGFALNFLRSGVYSLAGDLESDLDCLIEVGERDVVIAFSFMRYAVHTLGILEAVAQANPTVYVVTDSLLSPLTSYSDNVLLIHNRSLGVVPSLTPTFSLIHLIVAAAGAHMDKEKVRHRLESLESVYKSYGMVTDGLSGDSSS